MDFDMITFLQWITVAIPFVAMIAISIALVVQERQDQRLPRPHKARERLLGAPGSRRRRAAH